MLMFSSRAWRRQVRFRTPVQAAVRRPCGPSLLDSWFCWCSWPSWFGWGAGDCWGFCSACSWVGEEEAAAVAGGAAADSAAEVALEDSAEAVQEEAAQAAPGDRAAEQLYGSRKTYRRIGGSSQAGYRNEPGMPGAIRFGRVRGIPRPLF